MDTVEELVESYICGNISWVSDKLKKAKKVKVLEFAKQLTELTKLHDYPEDGIDVTIKLLNR